MARPDPVQPTRTDGLVTRDIFGVGVIDTDRAGAARLVEAAIASGRLLRVAFLNAHNANVARADADLRACLRLFAVFADGLGMDLAARMIHGSAFSDNLNGTDFVPALLAASTKPLRVALWGGRPGVAQKAAGALSIIAPQHQFSVACHGFADAARQASALTAMARERPDMLIVCLGTPAQEKWTARTISARHCSVVITAGALFDFLAEEVARAPGWLRALRGEWLFRLAQEPSRLWKRYLLGNPLFMSYVLRQKLAALRIARQNDPAR